MFTRYVCCHFSKKEMCSLARSILLLFIDIPLIKYAYVCVYAVSSSFYLYVVTILQCIHFACLCGGPYMHCKQFYFSILVTLSSSSSFDSPFVRNTINKWEKKETTNTFARTRISIMFNSLFCWQWQQYINMRAKCIYIYLVGRCMYVWVSGWCFFFCLARKIGAHVCIEAQPTVEYGAKRAAIKLPECLDALFCVVLLLLLLLASCGKCIRSGSIAPSQHIQHMHMNKNKNRVYAQNDVIAKKDGPSAWYMRVS